VLLADYGTVSILTRRAGCMRCAERRVTVRQDVSLLCGWISIKFGCGIDLVYCSVIIESQHSFNELNEKN